MVLRIDKYIPRSTKALLTSKVSQKAIETIRTSVRNHTPVLIYGIPGCGKTLTANLILQEFNYRIVYKSASTNYTKEELLRIRGEVKRKSLEPFAVILDDIGQVKNWSILEKIITESEVPLILITQEAWKLPKNIRDLPTKVEINPPYLQSVRKYIRTIAEKEGLKYNASNVTRDVRASLNALLNQGSTYDVTNNFSVTREVFDGKTKNFNMKKHKQWLLGNLTNLLKGLDVCDALDVINMAYRFNDKEILQFLPKGSGRVEYPLFPKMLQQHKSKKD